MANHKTPATQPVVPIRAGRASAAGQRSASASALVMAPALRPPTGTPARTPKGR